MASGGGRGVIMVPTTWSGSVTSAMRAGAGGGGASGSARALALPVDEGTAVATVAGSALGDGGSLFLHEKAAATKGNATNQRMFKAPGSLGIRCQYLRSMVGSSAACRETAPPRSRR